MVGYAFMGKAHSVGWRMAHRAFDLPLRPEMRAIVGRDRAGVTAAADEFGWDSVETDWRTLLTRDDIDVVDICTPGDTHAEIAIAALDAGKHVLCEKPLANSVSEAEQMVAAAERAAARGVQAMCGFNYRRLPATALARQWIAEGRLGRIYHVRAQYLQDWIADPQSPMVWRLDKNRAGSGALGDIGAHIVDLTQYLMGEQLTGVSGITTTFVPTRPLADGSGTGQVTVDDAAVFVGRFPGGALASYEATRFAVGRKNSLRLEINGERGSLAFDLESLNDLWWYDNADPATEAGFRRILVTEPEHPYAGAWWPPGHGIGYEHSFVHEMADFVTGIATGRPASPTFAEALRVQQVLDAVERSAAAGSGWQQLS
ncbi:Gfo/Idh/MocA family protein [Nakamurella aerolata]|uniref:Gfo/Idh/MocA family oxidoreductase n=1 Tax=Nakamurella aerolata TaxID=1656892 RepID=A0A849A5Z9_9ACTN|nr:Gfo/Idh/MocA family oxidoreductase [Nakamurella aerolata]NNG34823.1 Gfo/Idh/MocA family oxidoreductase [Nakamurella aerolata]